MTYRTLYIIGNGFDLWHGIPSGYGQFKEYVRAHDQHVFDAVETYLPAGEDWSELESALAEVDVENIVSDLEHFMVSYGAEDWSDAYHHDFQYEVGQLVQRLSAELRRHFGLWIRQLAIPTPATAKNTLRSLDAAATFLTFNYTSTLHDLYGVPDSHVLHIHGNASLEDSDLILGHAWNPQERKSLNDRADIEEIDIRLMQAHDILDDYFSNTFKPSDRLIESNRIFFEQLGKVERVCVLGHSLSDVDMPYLKALLAIPGIAAAQWHIACRSDDEHPAKRARLNTLGVQSRQSHNAALDPHLERQRIPRSSRAAGNPVSSPFRLIAASPLMPPQHRAIRINGEWHDGTDQPPRIHRAFAGRAAGRVVPGAAARHRRRPPLPGA